MRRIRFKPELITAIRIGRKVMTFRKTQKPDGNYIVEEGGKPYWVHNDTGLRICIVRSWHEPDIKDYANRYFDLEGFESPQAFLDYVLKLYKQDKSLPAGGWAHLFWAAEGDVALETGKAIPLTKETEERSEAAFGGLARVFQPELSWF